MDLALAPKDAYFADMIDKACVGIGCSETTLIELFVTTKNADIAAGRKAWEGRTDKNLIDYLDDELTESYKHLQHLIFKILKGERDESGEVDEAAAVKQVEAIHKECDKGMFSDFKEQARAACRQKGLSGLPLRGSATVAASLPRGARRATTTASFIGDGSRCSRARA